VERLDKDFMTNIDNMEAIEVIRNKNLKIRGLKTEKIGIFDGEKGL